jgi:hypothetical protein
LCREPTLSWPCIVIEKIKGVSRVQKSGFGFTQVKVCDFLSHFRLVFSSEIHAIHGVRSWFSSAAFNVHGMHIGFQQPLLLSKTHKTETPLFQCKLERLSFNIEPTQKTHCRKPERKTKLPSLPKKPTNTKEHLDTLHALTRKGGREFGGERASTLRRMTIEQK